MQKKKNCSKYIKTLALNFVHFTWSENSFFLQKIQAWKDLNIMSMIATFSLPWFVAIYFSATVVAIMVSLTKPSPSHPQPKPSTSSWMYATHGLGWRVVGEAHRAHQGTCMWCISSTMADFISLLLWKTKEKIMWNWIIFQKSYIANNMCIVNEHSTLKHITTSSKRSWMKEVLPWCMCTNPLAKKKYVCLSNQSVHNHIFLLPSTV